jgi:hypothetical protein
MSGPTQYCWDMGEICPTSRKLCDALLPMFDGPNEWVKILNSKAVLVGRGSRKATVIIHKHGNLISVSPGRWGVQCLIFLLVHIGYIVFFPGLILAFLVQYPYIKHHSEMSVMACMGLIVGLNATPNDRGDKSSKLFDHIDSATWRQIEIEYHGSKKQAYDSRKQQFQTQPSYLNSHPSYAPPSMPSHSPPQSTIPTIQPHYSANPTPPESWVGKMENDGYEYIEYPNDSGITYYRYRGERQWKKWNDGQSQTLTNESSAMQLYASQPTTAPPNFSPPPPPSSPKFTPSYSSSPPPYGHPPSMRPSVSTAPRRDNFMMMDTSSRRQKRSGLKTVIGSIIVLSLLIILPGILYVWASSLAADSDSDLSDEGWFDDNDNDGDGVDDDWDNCVFDYNPDQEDFDSDSEGDVCDSDIDGDGYLNSNDFHDYGDGVLIFKWSYARIDDSETYDSDGSGPDVYAKLYVDWNSDGTTDNTYTSSTTNNIKEWPNLYEKELNAADNSDEIKVTVRLFDDDYSDDDELDYVSGSGDYYVFTIPLYQSYYDSESYDGRDGYKGLKVTFIWDVDTK